MRKRNVTDHQNNTHTHIHLKERIRKNSYVSKFERTKQHNNNSDHKNVKDRTKNMHKKRGNSHPELSFIKKKENFEEIEEDINESKDEMLLREIQILKGKPSQQKEIKQEISPICNQSSVSAREQYRKCSFFSLQSTPPFSFNFQPKKFQSLRKYSQNVNVKMTEQIVKEINQFMTYLQQKQHDSQRLSKLHKQQMEQFPLERTQKQLEEAKAKKQAFLNTYNKIKQQNGTQEEEARRQTQEIEEEIRKYNGAMQKMIDEQVKNRERSKTTTRLEQEIKDKIKQTEQEHQQQVRIKDETKRKLEKSKKQKQEKISEYEKEMETYKQIKGRVEEVKDKLYVTQKMQNSTKLIHEQLIRDIAKLHLKSQFTFSDKIGQKNQANRQLLEEVFKSVNKKLVIIKSAIDANSQNVKFMNNLKILEKSNPESLKFTYESNELTAQQQKYLTTCEAECQVYKQYLQNRPQTEKMRSILKQQTEKYQYKYTKIKQQVDIAKKQYKQATDKINQLDNMEKIRTAEITELKKILEDKHNEIVNRTKQYYNEMNTFNNFRDALVGLTGAKGSPEKKQLRKSKFNF